MNNNRRRNFRSRSQKNNFRRRNGGHLNNSSANQNTSVVGSIKMFSGLADNCDIAETGDTASVTLHAENRLITLQQARSRRYTHEDQQIDFSDDDGLSFVNSIVEKEILWGRG